MMRLESDFRAAFLKELKRYKGWGKPLVANSLQAGLPDLLVVSRTGYTFHYEAKVWKNVKPPTQGVQLQNQLDGPQIAVITGEFWPRGAYCPIVSFSLDQVSCHYFDGDRFYPNLRWTDVARQFAELKHGERYADW